MSESDHLQALQQAFNFTEDDFWANSKGYISEKQAKGWIRFYLQTLTLFTFNLLTALSLLVSIIEIGSDFIAICLFSLNMVVAFFQLVYLLSYFQSIRHCAGQITLKPFWVVYSLYVNQSFIGLISTYEANRLHSGEAYVINYRRARILSIYPASYVERKNLPQTVYLTSVKYVESLGKWRFPLYALFQKYLKALVGIFQNSSSEQSHFSVDEIPYEKPKRK